VYAPCKASIGDWQRIANTGQGTDQRAFLAAGESSVDVEAARGDLQKDQEDQEGVGAEGELPTMSATNHPRWPIPHAF
jgi:hypothetical protein